MPLNIDLSSGTVDADFYDTFLMALCCWREARGEIVAGKYAVCWSIKNRADHPSWWGGPSISSVVLKPMQYSSFNANDPNATKFPLPTDTSWTASLLAAGQVLAGMLVDPTMGATHYFDSSMDANPPVWAKDGSKVLTVTIGNLHFWKLA